MWITPVSPIVAPDDSRVDRIKEVMTRTEAMIAKNRQMGGGAMNYRSGC